MFLIYFLLFFTIQLHAHHTIANQIPPRALEHARYGKVHAPSFSLSSPVRKGFEQLGNGLSWFKKNKLAVLAMLLAAVPHEPVDASVGNQFLISNPSSVDQLLPSLAARNDGNLFVLWNEGTNNVMLRTVGQNGIISQPVVATSNPHPPYLWTPAISAFADNTALASWVDGNNNLVHRLINVAGLPVGNDTQPLAANASLPFMLPSPDGTVMSIYTHERNITGQKFNSVDGSVVSAQSLTAQSGPYDVTYASNGNLFFAQVPEPESYKAQLSLFTEQLVPSIDAVTLPLPSQTHGIAVGSYGNNNLFVAWESNQLQGGTSLAGAILDGITLRVVYDLPNLSSEQIYFATLGNYLVGSRAGSAASFNNGNNILLVFAGQTQTGAFNIYGTIIDAFGNVNAGPFMINQPSGEDQQAPVATSLIDGGVFIAWQGKQTAKNEIYGVTLTASQLQSIVNSALASTNSGLSLQSILGISLSIGPVVTAVAGYIAQYCWGRYQAKKYREHEKPFYDLVRKKLKLALWDFQAKEGENYINAIEKLKDAFKTVEIAREEQLARAFAEALQAKNMVTYSRDLLQLFLLRGRTRNDNIIGQSETIIADISERFKRLLPDQKDVNGHVELTARKDNQEVKDLEVVIQLPEANLTEKQSLEADLKMAIDHYYKKAYADAIQLLEPLFAQDQNRKIKLEAAHFLGKIYYHHSENSDKYVSAIRYFKIAEEQDEDLEAKIMAQQYLGWIYETGGFGVTPSVARAMKYCEQTVNQNRMPQVKVYAQLQLARIYSNAGIVQFDLKKAQELYMQLAEQKCDNTKHDEELKRAKNEALQFLGRIYFDGSSVEKDYDRASFYYEQLAHQNENADAKALAQLKLGLIYFCGGPNMPANPTRSVKYFEAASQQKSNYSVQANAFFYLGIMHELGKGLCRSYTDAREYFMKAENQFDSQWARTSARLHLGKIYYCGGFGLDKDREEARNYFKLAAEQKLDSDVQAEAERYLKELDAPEDTTTDIEPIESIHAVV